METLKLKGYKETEFNVFNYEVANPKGIFVIIYGLAEAAIRYDYFANMLNKANYNAYIIEHIGHGPDKSKEQLGHWDKGDFDGCIYNYNVLVTKLHEEFKDLPFILFGHSMGSFMAQRYDYLYPNNFNATILSGCAKPDFLYKCGKMLARLVYTFNKPTKRAKIMDNIAFGTFNKQFVPNKTNCDWLTKDENICKWYQETPYIGFVGTASFYKEFYNNVSAIPNKKYASSYKKGYPLLLIGGQEDMVSGMGKKLLALEEYYKKQEVDVTAKLFAKDRHEILNELDKDEVIKYLLDWSESKVYAK